MIVCPICKSELVLHEDIEITKKYKIGTDNSVELIYDDEDGGGYLYCSNDINHNIPSHFLNDVLDIVNKFNNGEK